VIGYENVSIVQNFICTKDLRLDVLLENLPKMAKVFSDYSFYVNYNTNKNLDIIRELYEDNVKNLKFYTDFDKNWGKITLNLVKQIKTPYVLYLTEDFVCHGDVLDWENIFNEALFENNVKHIFLAKIHKYLPGYWDPDPKFKPYVRSEHKYEEGSHIWMWDSKNSPLKTYSTVAVHEKELFIKLLNDYIKIYSYKTPNDFESIHQNLTMMKNMKCAIPKKIIIEQIHKDGCVE